ncbi:MAG: VWA domain-containing protein, partial [Polyangiales bacterium]
IKNNDRVGLILFTDKVERFVPPKKGRSHVMRVVTEILNANPQNEGTDLGVALDLLGGIGKRRTVAFLISDFIAEQYEKPLRVVSAKHDLIPIQIVDPREDELPDVGFALVEDLETGEILEVDTSNLDVRAEYAREAQRQRASREHLFRRLKLDHCTVSTDRDFVKPLTELFRLRQRRMTGFR